MTKKYATSNPDIPMYQALTRFKNRLSHRYQALQKFKEWLARENNRSIYLGPNDQGRRN